MTEENGFHAAIAATPADPTNLLVFADWLDDRGDPRADGYRALARLGMWTPSFGNFTWVNAACYTRAESYAPRNLPADWFEALEGWTCVMSGEPVNKSDRWRDYDTSAAAFDAAALAFARLPEPRRRELLDG